MPRELQKLLGVSWRLNAIIIAAFAITGVLFYFGPSPLGLWRQNERAACEKKCSELKRSARLVPARSLNQIPQGKFEGPWRCECY